MVCGRRNPKVEMVQVRPVRDQRSISAQRSAGAAGALVARSVGGVSISGTGGEGALVEGEGTEGTSELWAAKCGGLCRMSRICCFTSGGNLARMSG